MRCQYGQCQNKNVAHYKSINIYLCGPCADSLFGSAMDEKKSTLGQVTRSSVLSLKGYRRELKTE